MESSGILLLSELYPPTVGGSGVLLESLYSRLGDHHVDVLTDGNGSRVQRGLAVHAMPMCTPDWGILGRGSLARHLRVAREVRRRTSAATVVHCARGLPEGLSARLSGRRYVCWTHGEELGYASTSRELRWLLPRIYTMAAAVVANSRNSAQLLTRWGLDEREVTIIHPGVDVDRFHPGVPPGSWRDRYASQDELVLLSVGRLQKRKGHDLMLSALAKWRPQDPPVRYLIAGDGEERGSLERQADQLGVRDRVAFLGVIAETELPGLYAAADIFAMPNRVDGVDFEGFGIVFLEAAAAGLPCIAGRSGGAAEAVQDGETGILVSGVDSVELALSLRRLAESSEQRAKMGARGRERVVREFTWEHGARRLSELQHRLQNDVAART